MNPVFVVSGRPSPAEQLKAFLSKARQNIFLFSPYVKVDPLRELLSITNVDVTLVTKLSERDVVLGASDVDLFPLCNELGVKLLIRNDLHLKAFVTDWEAICLGSSNITASGLGMRSGANYELNVIENSLTLDVIVYHVPGNISTCTKNSRGLLPRQLSSQKELSSVSVANEQNNRRILSIICCSL